MPAPFREMIDLSHDMFEGMRNGGGWAVSFPLMDNFARTRQMTNGLAAYETHMMLFPEHCGTHLDAPRHFHDLRDLYHQGGQEPPVYIRREIEKCDDRLRHLLEDAYKEGGHFEKIRQEMSMRSGNRYDHTTLLASPTEQSNETGNRKEDNGDQGSLEGI